MDILQKTQELCRYYDIKPARSKGQNFLINEEIYNRVVAAADLKSDDVVLEVGPGLGFLTTKLASKVKKVITVELDDRLAEVLHTGLMAQNIKNVEVVNQDILKLPINLIKYKIVANLPYNITSIFLRKYLEIENKAESMVLMLQKEVAERIIAKPGKMSLLSVSIQFYARAEIVEVVRKENFWPEPEVDSAIIKITPRNVVLLAPEKEKDFFRLVKFGFSARRKMLKNNLAAGLKLDQAEVENKIVEAGLKGKIRAQELSVNDWLKLLSIFS
jgi:16S rRNA (adenine1518-N6/adenine1519-N6)-dimethyltransferase